MYKVNYFDSLDYIEALRKEKNPLIEEVINLFDIIYPNYDSDYFQELLDLSIEIEDRLDKIRICKSTIGEFEEIINSVMDEGCEADEVIFVIGKMCYEITHQKREKKSIHQEIFIDDYINITKLNQFLSETYMNDNSEEIMSLYDKEFLKAKKRAFIESRKCIIEYFKSQKYPFTKKDVYKNFRNFSKLLIDSTFKTEKKLISYYHEYIWYDNLNINTEDEILLRNIIKSVTSDSKVHHIQEIYEYLESKNMYWLKSNMITTAYRLFGILKVIIGDEYKLDRPYIAKKDVKISSVEERLQNFVKHKDKVKLSEILQYARDNYMQVNSMIDLFNSLNKTHIFLNKYELISIKRLSIDFEKKHKIIDILQKQANEKPLYAICELSYADELPDIGVEWNEWVIYSIMNIWGCYPKVFLSSNMFKDAIPMITTKYSQDELEVARIAEKCKNRTLKVADNMNNIDELLEDIIDDFIEDIEF